MKPEEITKIYNQKFQFPRSGLIGLYLMATLLQDHLWMSPHKACLGLQNPGTTQPHWYQKKIINHSLSLVIRALSLIICAFGLMMSFRVGKDVTHYSTGVL